MYETPTDVPVAPFGGVGGGFGGSVSGGVGGGVGGVSATAGVDVGTPDGSKYVKNMGANGSGFLQAHAQGPTIRKSSGNSGITRKSTNATPFDTGEDAGHVGLAGTGIGTGSGAGIGTGFNIGIGQGISENAEKDAKFRMGTAENENMGQNMSVSMPDLSVSAPDFGFGANSNAGAGIGAGFDADPTYAQVSLVPPTATAAVDGGVAAPAVAVEPGNVNFLPPKAHVHKKTVPLPTASASVSIPSVSTSATGSTPGVNLGFSGPSTAGGIGVGVPGPSTSLGIGVGAAGPSVKVSGPAARGSASVKVQGGVKVKKPNFFQRLIARFGGGGAKRRGMSAGAGMSVSTPALNIQAAPSADVVRNHSFFFGFIFI